MIEQQGPPTREMKSPRTDCVEIEVEFDSQKKIYKQVPLTLKERKEGEIDAEMSDIRRILGNAQVLGVNHFPEEPEVNTRESLSIKKEKDGNTKSK